MQDNALAERGETRRLAPSPVIGALPPWLGLEDAILEERNEK